MKGCLFNIQVQSISFFYLTNVTCTLKLAITTYIKNYATEIIGYDAMLLTIESF